MSRDPRSLFRLANFTSISLSRFLFAFFDVIFRFFFAFSCTGIIIKYSLRKLYYLLYAV